VTRSKGTFVNAKEVEEKGKRASKGKEENMAGAKLRGTRPYLNAEGAVIDSQFSLPSYRT
jgi:hypothetical protein